MTTVEILEFHNISFINQESSLDISPTKLFIGGRAMETFFFLMNDPDDIDTEIIPRIDHYLAGNTFPIDNDLTVGGGDFVKVTLGGVNFINMITMAVEQIVPLNHFKEIAIAWADYNRNNTII
jgi:hypothetical protein